ncbi:DNA-binding transcriptional LysR family regulator [Burkholderia sp. 140710050-1]
MRLPSLSTSARNIHRPPHSTMRHLPDLEAWAIFVRVAETGSFSKAAALLGMSQPTVSKAIARLEQRLRTTLLYRTPRKLSLTPTGEVLRDRTIKLLADAECIECDASAYALEPHGLVRINAPMSFGVHHLAPVLPAFLERYPHVDIDLVLTDRLVDIVSDGFDIAIRIAKLDDSTLRARPLCPVRRSLVASRAYLDKYGSPAHPRDLGQHLILLYTNLPTPESWHFRNTKSGEEFLAPVRGRIRSNNAEVIMPALIGGHGLALQPEFVIWETLQRGELEIVMQDWAISDININLVTPPGMLRPARVTLLLDFLAECFAQAPWTFSEL